MRGQPREVAAGARTAVAESPAFAVYLAALALLPFRWLSPIGSLYEHADWTDLLIGVATVLWLFEHLQRRDLAHAVRVWHLPLIAYLALGCASAAQAVPYLGGSFKTVLLMAELAVLAGITADFASPAVRRRLIARVIVASALVTLVLGAIGLMLFYAGVHSGLVGVYGEQYVPSHVYTRIQAGFESPPLLASYCIFASGVVAGRDAALGPRLRLTTQVCLGLLCAATLSRGLIAFLFAAIIRYSAGLQGRRRWAVPTAAAIAGLLLLAALTVGRLHLNPVKPSTFSYVVPDPGNRREAFVTSLTTFEHHPLLGIGPGALPGINAGAPFRAHFTPLNIAATLGLPALLMLIAAIVLLWRTRLRPTDIALWSALAGIALDGLAQDIDHFRHVWVLLGLVAGPARGGAREPAGGVSPERRRRQTEPRSSRRRLTTP
jgi:O-Antigen ligase